MKFSEWVERELKKNPDKSKTQFLREFSEKAKVSLQTLQTAERGGRMRRFDKADAISLATGRKVSISDLCEEKTKEK